MVVVDLVEFAAVYAELREALDAALWGVRLKTERKEAEMDACFGTERRVVAAKEEVGDARLWESGSWVG